MRTITIDLEYDAISKLHHLPLDALGSVTEDIHLCIRSPVSGIKELSGMVAIENAIVSPEDIKRALDTAMTVLHVADEGVVMLLMPETSYEVRCSQFYPDVPETRSVLFSTGSMLPLGFPGDSLIVTIGYIFLPSCTLPKLKCICADRGVNIVRIEILEK
ncbi:hypothetical protein [Propionivibrio sp.]|uniref:hypothetical protein n=1 Tax=Propionivibrio sp. TaxID=2212460 RepID=UPI003BF0DBD7